jgi:K+-transporting ATPase KdpF subunit
LPSPAVAVKNYAGCHLHCGRDFRFCVAGGLRGRLRKTLKFDFMENIILGIISVALCGYLIFAMVRPEKF